MEWKQWISLIDSSIHRLNYWVSKIIRILQLFAVWFFCVGFPQSDTPWGNRLFLLRVFLVLLLLQSIFIKPFCYVLLVDVAVSDVMWSVGILCRVWSLCFFVLYLRSTRSLWSFAKCDDETNLIFNLSVFHCHTTSLIVFLSLFETHTLHFSVFHIQCFVQCLWLLTRF